jgi:uncharacterized membrane protein
MSMLNNFRENLLKVLTGMSIGIVVALVPFALFAEIARALGLTTVLNIVVISSRLLALVMGLCIAKIFNFNPIQSGSLALATMIGSGALRISEGTFILAGVGDVINAGITAGIAIALIKVLGERLKAYSILLIPSLVVLIAGGIGLFTLPYVAAITTYIGVMVNLFVTLQPILMGMLIGITFALVIVSPVSTVAVALAISLAGVGSGAANIGITAAGFGLAIYGFTVNGFGTSIAHFLGSPKMQMANFAKNPKMIIPVLVSAGINGAFAGIFSIQGSPLSAGFGISGLIGPLNHLGLAGYNITNVLITVLVFVVLPIATGFLTKYLFISKMQLVSEEDYKIDF